MVLGAAWSSAQWGAFIIIATTSVGGMIVQIINAIRQGARIDAVHNQVVPPSNGRTLGALVESQAVVQHILAQDYANRVRETGGNPPVIPPTLTANPADYTGDVQREAVGDRRGIAAVVKAVEKVGESVAQVHSEIQTTNGLTIAALSDRAEGRRIQEDVPTAERTDSEQHYVDNLNDPTVNPGE